MELSPGVGGSVTYFCGCPELQCLDSSLSFLSHRSQYRCCPTGNRHFAISLLLVILSLSKPCFLVWFLLARFPLYYELKIAFVIWLLSPYTRGASLIYRKFLHPLLSSKERVSEMYGLLPHCL